MKLWHLVIGFLILRHLSIKSAAVAECLWLKHAYNNQGKPFKPLLLREAKGQLVGSWAKVQAHDPFSGGW
jgi:hypothetical protein